MELDAGKVGEVGKGRKEGEVEECAQEKGKGGRGRCRFLQRGG